MRWEQRVLVVARSVRGHCEPQPGTGGRGTSYELLRQLDSPPSQPSLILSQSLSPFFGPQKILLEAFICLKSYRRTLWALSFLQVSSIKIGTVITEYQRGQQIFRLIFSNLNKVDIYNPLLFST